MRALRIERYSEASHDALIEELTEILHEAYGALAKQGMRYWASFQTPAETKQRLSQGEAYLAFDEGAIAGTISLCGPELDSGAAFYRKPGVYSFRQFAVSPRRQGRGIGAALLDCVEARARELGASHLALDTAETAESLISLYKRRGYEFIEYVQWDGRVNYRSVILAKAL